MSASAADASVGAAPSGWCSGAAAGKPITLFSSRSVTWDPFWSLCAPWRQASPCLLARCDRACHASSHWWAVARHCRKGSPTVTFSNAVADARRGLPGSLARIVELRESATDDDVAELALALDHGCHGAPDGVVDELLDAFRSRTGPARIGTDPRLQQPGLVPRLDGAGGAGVVGEAFVGTG